MEGYTPSTCNVDGNWVTVYIIMEEEASKWVIVEEEGGGSAASVIKTSAAKAMEATWE